MIYQWKTGSRFKTDVNIAAAEINRLEAEKGNELEAHELVDASRPEDAPLHNEFEWDDAVAAEEWRIHTARKIIHSINVIIEDVPVAEPVRAFFVVDKATHKYEPIHVILNSPTKTEALLQQALRELISFKKKYSMLKELSDLFSDIDKAKQRYMEGES